MQLLVMTNPGTQRQRLCQRGPFGSERVSGHAKAAGQTPSAEGRGFVEFQSNEERETPTFRDEDCSRQSEAAISCRREIVTVESIY
jgi:hypothetical protein